MLKIDAEKMLIELTRGDTANIVFSAKTEEGEEYEPVALDSLSFSVAKKIGGEPLMAISTLMEEDAEQFWTITISREDWLKKNDDGEVIYEDGKPIDLFKFGDYVFDVQLKTADGQVDTIIGATDTLSPTFRVWGEVGEE